MSKLFTSCFSCTKHRRDHDRDEIVSTQPRFERKIEISKQLQASDFPRKPRLSEQTAPDSPRRPRLPEQTAPDSPRRPRLSEQTAPDSPSRPRLSEQTAPTSPKMSSLDEQRELDRGVKRESIIPPGPHIYPDKFVGSPDVFGLPSALFKKVGLPGDLFYSFLGDKDAAMVFFYDPESPRSESAKHQFRKAAENTDRPNHGYAAIDCTQLPNICKTEKIDSLPAYKLYSYGRMVGQYDDETSASDLKRFTETSPVASDPPRVAPVSCLDRLPVT